MESRKLMAVMSMALMIGVCVPLMASSSYAADADWTLYTDEDFTVAYDGGATVGAVYFTFISDKTANTPTWITGWDDTSLSGHTPSTPGLYEVPMIIGFVQTTTGDTNYYERTLYIQVNDKPNVDFNNPGLDRYLDNYLNPEKDNQGTVTLEVNEDRAIRLRAGTYQFKFGSWWFSENHYATLTGDTHGLVQDSNGYWVGQLSGGQTYTFTVDVGGKASFNFNIRVNDVTRTITYNNEGTITTQTVGWGDEFSLSSPTNGNYTLSGWYDAASGGNRIGGAGDTMRAYDNVTYYAHWISVLTIVSPVGSVDVVEVDKGGSYLMPTAVRDGYVFKYWAYDAAGQNIAAYGNEYVTPYGSATLYPIFSELLVFGEPSFSLIGEQ